MQTHKRVGVIPVTAGQVVAIDHQECCVAFLQHGIDKGHADSAGTNNKIVCVQFFHVGSFVEAARRTMPGPGGKVETNEQCDEAMSDLKNWSARPAPALPPVSGKYVQVESARFPEHGPALFDVLCGPGNEDLWRYVPLGPFDDAAAFIAAMSGAIQQFGWQPIYCLTPLRAKRSVWRAICVSGRKRVRRKLGASSFQKVATHAGGKRSDVFNGASYIL